MSLEAEEEPSLGGPSPPPEEESFGAASPVAVAAEDPEPRSPREQPTREVEMSSEAEEPSLGGPSPPPEDESFGAASPVAVAVEDESFGAASPVAVAVEAEEEPSLGGPSPPPEEESFGAASPAAAAAEGGPEPRSPCARPAREVFGVSSPVVSEFCRQPSRNPDRDVACETPPGGADASGVDDDDDADEQFTVGEKSIASDPSSSWKLTPLPALDMEAARRVMASDNAAEDEEEEAEEEGPRAAAAAAASGSGAAPEARTEEEREDRAGAGGDAGSSSKPSSRAGSDDGGGAAAAAAAGAGAPELLLGAEAQPRCERPAPEVFGVASPVVSEFCRQPSRNPDRNVVRETPSGADTVPFDDDADADEQFAVGEKSFTSDPSNSMRLTPLPALDLEGCSSRPASRAESKAGAAAAAAADAEEGAEGADAWPGVFGVASPVVGEFCRQPSRNPHRDVAREPSGADGRGAEEDEADEQFRVGSKSITSDPSSSLRLSPLPALDVHGCSSKPASRVGSNSAAAAAAAAAAEVGPEAQPRSEWPAPGVFDVASPVVGEFCRQPSRNPDRNVVCETPSSADVDAFGLDNDADEQQFVVGSKSITSDPSNSLKLTPLPVLDMEVAREKDKGASEPAGAPLADIEEEEAEGEGEGGAAGGRSVPSSLIEGGRELFGASSPVVGEFCRQPSRSPDRGLGSEGAGAVDATFDLDEDADADERFTVGSKSISSDPSNSLKLTPLPALEVDGTGGVQSSHPEPPPGSSSSGLPAALRGPLDSDGAAAEGGPQPVGGALREADRRLAPLLEAEAASAEESPSRQTSPGQPPSPPAGERGRGGGLSPPHGEQRDRRASMQSLVSNRSAFEVSDSEDDEEGQLFSIEEEQTRKAGEDEEGLGSQGGSLPASLQRPPPQRRQAPPGPAAASTHSMQLQASRVGSVPPPLPHSGASSEILSGQYYPTQRMLSFKQIASGRRLACSNQTLKQAAALQSTNQRSGKEEAIDFMEQMKAEGQSEFVDSIHKQKSLEDPSTCSPCSLHFVQLSACASQRDADEPASCTVT